MRQLTRRSAYGLAGLTLVAALTSGCLGQDREADPGKNADAKKFSLTIASNAIKGGKNAEGATWIEDWVIPQFVKAQKKKGVTATVKFEPSGVDDEDYKSKISLDMQSGKGADVMDVDGIWVGEFAESGYIKPLTEVVGKDVDKWDGWGQIPEAVQQNGSYQGKRYGVPAGTDGRVIYFNRKVFAKAGLPEDWQPTSWAEILDAAKTIKSKAPGVTPIQLNAGTAMGEATTMQGFLPLLAGVAPRSTPTASGSATATRCARCSTSTSPSTRASSATRCSRRRRRAATSRSRCSPRTRSASCWRATTSGATWSTPRTASPR